MTQKEKAKRYDEALKKAKEIIKYYKERNRNEASTEDLEIIFPELKDSEDERIRKALIDFFNRGAKNGEQTNGVYDKDILAWLEKQNPAWSEEDEERLESIIEECSFHKGRYKHEIEESAYYTLCEKNISWLKSIKDRVQPQSQQEWSEEDDENIMMIEDRFSDYLDYIREDRSLTKHRKNALKEEVIGHVNWFKSLRPQKQWKPSGEQMKALHDLNLTGHISYSGQGQTLIELYNNFRETKRIERRKTMTEEQVREAVKQGLETLKPKAMYVANIMLDAYSQGFWDAYGIVINCLWHEASEEPVKGKPFVILNISNEVIASYVIEDGGMTWEAIKKIDQAVKWMYVESILPKGGKQ